MNERNKNLTGDRVNFRIRERILSNEIRFCFYMIRCGAVDIFWWSILFFEFKLIRLVFARTYHFLNSSCAVRYNFFYSRSRLLTRLVLHGFDYFEGNVCVLNMLNYRKVHFVLYSCKKNK